MNRLLVFVVFFIAFSTQATELKELEMVLHQQSLQSEMPKDLIAFRQPVNDVLNALNRDWSDGNRELFAKELVQLWQREHFLNSKDRHNLLEATRVRIQFAGLLGMTERLCLDSVSKKELRDYVLNYVQSNNLSERALAIRMLGYVGNVDDVRFLSVIVKQEEQGVATFAALSLDTLHKTEAIHELFELEKNIKDPELKAFISGCLRPYREGIAIPIKTCN